MTKKRVTIVLTIDHHQAAKDQSKRIFGNVNLSQYLGFLIEREKGKQL
jgi:hypothetical protein